MSHPPCVACGWAPAACDFLPQHLAAGLIQPTVRNLPFGTVTLAPPPGVRVTAQLLPAGRDGSR